MNTYKELEDYAFTVAMCKFILNAAFNDRTKRKLEELFKRFDPEDLPALKLLKPEDNPYWVQYDFEGVDKQFVLSNLAKIYSDLISAIESKSKF